jgi:flagellar basal-body rod modification protein FlgD
MQTLGKDDFLQLLVAKLQYQDPMDPMADEDFIAQLAQFSSLEQMYNISEGISASNQWDYLQMQSINNTMAAGLIGKEIEANYEGVFLDTNSTPTISFTTDDYASDIKFVIRDSSGQIVATLHEADVEAGTGSVVWDGTDSTGNRVAEGYYSVEAAATDSNGAAFTPQLGLVGVVSAITYRDGAAYLIVNGTEIPLGDVRGVGEPGTFSNSDDDQG